jgi:hypothetical protein
MFGSHNQILLAPQCHSAKGSTYASYEELASGARFVQRVPHILQPTACGKRNSSRDEASDHPSCGAAYTQRFDEVICGDLRVDFDDRAELLAADPDVYYVTEHYVGYSSVLVLLSRVNADVLRTSSAWPTSL